MNQTSTGGPHHDSTITPRDPNRANTATFPQGHRVLQKIYIDQIGRFPVTSSRGYKYIMIAYDYDSNNILAETIK